MKQRRPTILPMRSRGLTLLVTAAALVPTLVGAPSAGANHTPLIYANLLERPAVVQDAAEGSGCRREHPSWPNRCFWTESYGESISVPETVVEGQDVVVTMTTPPLRYYQVVGEPDVYRSHTYYVELCDPWCVDLGDPAHFVEVRPIIKAAPAGCVVAGRTTQCTVRFYRPSLPAGDSPPWFRVRVRGFGANCRSYAPGSSDDLILCHPNNFSYTSGILEISAPITIVGEAEAQSPTASFTSSEVQPGRFHFVSTSTDPRGQPLDHQWQFGDGGTAIGPSAVHDYQEPGVYPVRLTVTDPDGNVDIEEMTVVVAAPHLSVAIGLPDLDGQTLAPGEETMVRVTVEASSGVGHLSGVTFTGAPLTLDPAGRLEIVSGPGSPEPFTLPPNGRQVFDYRVRANDEIGNVVLASAVSATDAVGRAVQASTELTVGVREPVLEVEVTAKLADDPGPAVPLLQFRLREGPSGAEPREVLVNVLVRNVSDHDAEGVVLPAELELSSRSAAVPEPFPVEQVAAPEQLELGTLAAGRQVQEQYRLRVDDDGRFRVTARVQYANPSGAPPVNLVENGRVDIDAGPGALLYLDAEVHGPPVRTAGETYRVVGRVENRSTDQTVVLDPLFADPVRNAGGLTVRRSGSAPPPPGSCGVPVFGVLAPGEGFEFLVDVSTQAGRGTRSIVRFEPSGSVREPDGSSRELDQDEIYVRDGEDGARTVTVSLDDSVPVPDGGNVVTWALNFSVGVADSVIAMGEAITFLLDEWPRLLAEGVIGLPDAVSGAGRLLRAALVTMEYLASGVVALGLDPAAKEAYAREVASYFDEAMLIELGMTPDRLAFELGDFVDQLLVPAQTLLATGDYDGFARTMGRVVADVVGPDKVAEVLGAALRVGSCFLTGASARVRGVMQLSEHLPKGPPGLKNLPQEITELRVGQEIGAATLRKSFGVSDIVAQKVANFARDNDLIISLRFRQPRSLYWLDPPNNAVLKPEAIKIKNVDRVDIDFLGYRENDLASVVFKEPISAEVLESRLVGQTPEMQRLARSRWRTRVEEWNGKEGAAMRRYAADGNVDVALNYRGNAIGSDVRSGAVDLRRFELRDVPSGDGTSMTVVFMADDGGVMRRMTGDIDLVDVRHSNGLPLSVAERADFYDAIQPVIGLQHGETPTWVKDGDFLWEKKAQLLSDHVSNAGGEAVAQIGPDGQWRAAFIDPNLSYFDPAGYLSYIWWQGGYRSIDSAAYSLGARFTQGVADIVQGLVDHPFVPPTRWKVIGTTRAQAAPAMAAAATVTAGPSSSPPGPGRCSWQFADRDDARILSVNRSGTLEQWDGHRWRPADRLAAACAFRSLRFTLLPQSGVRAEVQAGATLLPVAALADFAPGVQTAWFTPTMRLIIDPGGPNHEETMVMVASDDVLTLAAPLAKAHRIDELVIAVTTSLGELPQTR